MQPATGYRIAIVGAGPRALGALEALARAVAPQGADGADTSCGIAVDLFDPIDCPGAGPNFDPGQSPLCLLNIPLRNVRTRPPAVPDFPDFAAWLGPAGQDPDRYPARAELGAWLAARLAALVRLAPFPITHYPLTADQLDHDAADGWWLRAGGSRFGPYAQVLLTQGQPRSAPDDQLARWQVHAQAVGADLLPAYPDAALLRAAPDWAGRSVAIRGLGLATLDVLRLLTLGQGGRFQDGRYHPSGREPARILPFSLDGMPPVPKPASAALDARFAPSPDETAAFSACLMRALRTDEPLQILCRALVDPVRRVTGADTAHVQAWLTAERDRPGTQGPSDPVAALEQGIAMAQGQAAPDIGYAVGQLWRKWQDALRKAFNPHPPPPAIAAAILGFDEGLKRYSYGPPASSAQELLVLIRAGRVDLRAADDPQVRPVPGGWQLVEGDDTALAQVMIDAVLPAPDIERLTDPMLAGLRDAGRIEARGEKLAARIRPDGQSIGKHGPEPGLSLLGRLALGSVVATDSIHDCFGAASQRWAGEVFTKATG